MKIVVIGAVAAGTSVIAKARRNSEEVEKKKEREEKDKQRQEQRKQMKDAIIKEIRKEYLFSIQRGWH